MGNISLVLINSYKVVSWHHFHSTEDHIVQSNASLQEIKLI